MNGKNYYEILGVQRNATLDVIKQQYRKLANLLHPDHNQGNKVAEEWFKDVSIAYACLSNPEKRKIYDERLNNAFRQEAIRQTPRPPVNHNRTRPLTLAEAYFLYLTARAIFYKRTKRRRKGRRW